MKYSAGLVSIAVAAAMLSACGGGGGSGASTSSSPPSVTTSTGILLDGPVVGIGYKTATQSGKTGTKGEFSYAAGETITFSIGNISLPTINAAATVTPLDMAQTTDIDHQVVSNIIVLLQSLDEDGDPSNGITIPAVAASRATTAVNFDVSPTAFATNPAVLELVANSGSTRKTLVSQASARTHFRNTLNGNGSTTKINVAPIARAGAGQSVLTGATVTLDGSPSSDANNDALSYAWTLTSRPAGSKAALNAPAAVQPTFVADVDGSYVATLVVNDGALSSPASEVTVVASAGNAAPIANAGASQSVTAGSKVTLDASASSDPNGDALTYAWTLTSRPAGSAAALTSTITAKPTFTADLAGTYVATLVVNDGKVDSAPARVTITATPAQSNAAFNMTQTLSDQAQSTTMAFSGLALMTGNLQAQSFFPPGKVADYTGFQFLRDNDPDNMGHNTSFLTRVANNVLYVLTDSQLAKLSALAATQQSQIDSYGYKRYPLMQAFRRLIDGNIPSGSSGLNLNAVKIASRELYLIDGQISFDRAVLYADIINSLSTSQRAHFDAMKGKGWRSWPDITDAQINAKMSGLAQGSKVAVMTYASDIYSWYAGSLEADVYFCPERHGTYYGGFYIKDAPAVGHEGYSIDEQMTATAGAALIDVARGYVNQSQATTMYSLVAIQKDNLNAIVSTRTQIATLLRSLLTAAGSVEAVKTQVLALSGTYGELDGANNYHYARIFAQVYNTLSADQKLKLASLRKSMMSGKYADGTAFDFSIATTPFLYSAVVSNTQIAPYVADPVTNALFFEP